MKYDVVAKVDVTLDLEVTVSAVDEKDAFVIASMWFYEDIQELVTNVDKEDEITKFTAVTLTKTLHDVKVIPNVEE
jgi:hypothetical protein